MMKTKSSEVIKVFILDMVAFNFFWEEGFWGGEFLLFKGSTSSLGDVNSLGFCSSSTSSPPHQSGDVDAVFTEVLLKFWTPSVFFCLLVLGVFYSL